MVENGISAIVLLVLVVLHLLVSCCQAGANSTNSSSNATSVPISSAPTASSTTQSPAASNNVTGAPNSGNASSSGNATGAPNNTTTAPQSSTMAPGSSNTATCDPSCAVNVYFSSFLQTDSNVQSLFTALATASGVGTLSRIQCNKIHQLYYGIPYGNGTLITVTIQSFPLGVCNRISNANGCLSLINQTNSPTILSALLQLGVTNSSAVPADAALPTFGVLGSVPSLYLAVYVGGGVGYVLFLLWTVYKFFIAIQLAANEKAREEAELAGMTVEELQEFKKRQEESKRGKTAKKRRPGGGPGAAAGGGPAVDSESVMTDQFAETDVDILAKQSIEKIVAKMKFRSSLEFQAQQQRREWEMQREMVPVVSPAIQHIVDSVVLPQLLHKEYMYDWEASNNVNDINLPDNPNTMSALGGEQQQKPEAVPTFQRGPRSVRFATDGEESGTPVIEQPQKPDPQVVPSSAVVGAKATSIDELL